MVKDFLGLFTTDHHTLHPHTPTRHILSNLSNFFYKENDLSKIKLVLYGGDFFHTLAMANDPDVVMAHRWIKNHLEICHANKTYVRVLEGTHSHDRGQPECFDVLKPKDSQYVKYIDTLSVEFIDELNLSILYVPDNFGKIPTEVIYERAIKLLASHNLTKVDIILLHGGFDRQLPPAANTHGTLYDSVKWQALAEHVIFSGHIHKPWEYGKIRCGGSFDRTAFGEMHPKGAYRFNFKNGKLYTSFWENKNAQIYDTLKVTREIDGLELSRVIDNYLAKTPKPGTMIRVDGGSGAVVGPVLDHYRAGYPMYAFDAKNAKEDNVDIDETLYTPEDYKGIVLSKANLEDNLLSFMETTLDKEKDNYDIAYLSELLNEAMNDD